MNQIRKTMIQEFIKHHELGALIFWRPDELVMLLGYMPHWGLSFLVYSADEEIVLYVPELEPEDILPGDIIIESYPWGNIHCDDPWAVLYQKMKQQIDRNNLLKRPISFIKYVGGTAPCRMSGEQPPLPYDLINNLEQISSAGYKRTSDNLLNLYTYKTQQDISGIRLAHIVAEKAVERFYELTQPEITEAEIASELEAIVQKMTGVNNIAFAKAWPLIQSGKNASAGGRYNRTTGKKLQDSEFVMLEMAICVNGYWADITRTASVGNVSKQMEEYYYTILEAQRKALSIMASGVKMKDVDAIARSHINQQGWGHLFNHGLGHQVGFRYHDPGDTLSPASDGILQEGMVVTVEPGIYGDEIGTGIRIEDNVFITNDGYELLSDYTRNLTCN